MTWVPNKKFSNAEEFIDFVKPIIKAHGVRITAVHVHHTWKPSHKDFNGTNHFALQTGMRNAHLARDFVDIAQHITVFPDGSIVTGRNIAIAPASATGYNDGDSDKQHPFMFEMIGNFDAGNDKLEGKQLETALKICNYFYDNNPKRIVFHRECLIHGKVPKTCPGTGVNKAEFIKQVQTIKLENVPQPVRPTQPSKPTNKPVVTVPSILLKHGYRGRPVQELQIILNKLGYKLVTDGIYGNQTFATVVNFQRKYKLNPDGIYGKNTQKVLIEALGRLV